MNDKNNDQDENHVKELESLGVKVILGSHPIDLIDETLGLNTRDTLKGVLENGIKGTLINGIKNKKK